MNSKKFLNVAAVALVDLDGRVLLAKRPEGKHLAGMWEFPGGKIEQNETPEAALIRELKEELTIDVKTTCLAPFTFSSHDYGDTQVLLLLYICRRWGGVPHAMEGQDLAWRTPKEMGELTITPAGLPLVAMLRDYL